MNTPTTVYVQAKYLIHRHGQKADVLIIYVPNGDKFDIWHAHKAWQDVPEVDPEAVKLTVEKP